MSFSKNSLSSLTRSAGDGGGCCDRRCWVSCEGASVAKSVSHSDVAEFVSAAFIYQGELSAASADGSQAVRVDVCAPAAPTAPGVCWPEERTSKMNGIPQADSEHEGGIQGGKLFPAHFITAKAVCGREELP